MICQKTAEMVNGELKFTYILAKKAFIYNRKYYNEKIIGQCLQGTVLKVENETIKIHLDIDKEQEEKTAYFYDWVPSTGNLFYCMPKVGTKVSLYICNRDEQSAKAINCVRTNGENCSELQNYNNRYFTSEHNKRIYLLPDEMGIQGAAGSPSLQMLLQDDSGIMLQSNKEFTISASQAIGITGENVTLSAPKQVTLSKSSSGGSATVNICNQFDIEGQIGKLDGSGGDVKIPSISGSSGEKVRKVDSDNAVYSSLVSVPKKKSEKMAINKALGALPNKISSNVDLE